MHLNKNTMKSMPATSKYVLIVLFFISRTTAFPSPACRNSAAALSNGLSSTESPATYSTSPRRCQERRNVRKLAASPMEKFMEGLADMMSPQMPRDDAPKGALEQSLTEVSLKGEGRAPPQDLSRFRHDLIKQNRMDNLKQQRDFTGYDMYDLIVEKFEVPYDVQISKTVFAGKPSLCLNVMWKYLGQSSFYLSEQAYLEHLEALAQLLKEWDRVEHFKKVLAQTRKKPNAYFGYAVALPLDLAPDTLAGYFDDSYF